MPRQHVRLDRGIGLLVGKLASSWRYLSLTAPPDKCVIARKGGRYPVAVPRFVMEPSSLPEWLEHSPSMGWLQRELVEYCATSPGGGEARAPLPT
jgi:hypothetical protein